MLYKAKMKDYIEIIDKSNEELESKTNINNINIINNLNDINNFNNKNNINTKKNINYYNKKRIKTNEDNHFYFEKTNKKNSNKKKIFNKKNITIIILIILIYIFYQPILISFLNVLKENPTFYYYYLFIKTQISNHTLLGLIFSSFLGSLFFLALPSEAIFIYFLNSNHYNILLIIITMIIGNLLGLIFNYYFGRIMGEKILRYLFKEKKFEIYKGYINNYGTSIILFGNIFPGPFEILSIFYGGFKFNFNKYFIISLIGRSLKYILLFIVFQYYWPYLNYYWNIYF